MAFFNFIQINEAAVKAYKDLIVIIIRPQLTDARGHSKCQIYTRIITYR